MPLLVLQQFCMFTITGKALCKMQRYTKLRRLLVEVLEQITLELDLPSLRTLAISNVQTCQLLEAPF